MKAIINYHSKRTNPFTIITVFFGLATIGLLICELESYHFIGYADENIAPAWVGIVGMALFLAVLLISGRKQLYKTALPVLAVLVSMVWLELNLMYGNYAEDYTQVVLLILSGIITISVIRGWLKIKWIMAAAWTLTLILRGTDVYYMASDWSFKYMESVAVMHFSVLAGMLTMLVFALSLKPNYEGEEGYAMRPGDRNDGRRLRSLPPMSKVEPYIMVERNDALNFFRDTVDITNTEEYIRKKRREGYSGFGIMHVMLAAYVRAVAKYPALNRFISGQRHYSRYDLEVNLDVKKEMTTEAPDTIIKVDFDVRDTAMDVYKKIDEKVKDVKGTPLDSDFDNLARVINYIPGLLLKFAVFLLKLLDYFGLLPRALTKLSPFHGSFFITSMGSLGIPPVFHHIYNFGNVPLFCSFGCKKTVREFDALGNMRIKKCVDWTLVCDERICDGFYFATAFKYYKYLIAHPEELDCPPLEIIEDID